MASGEPGQHRGAFSERFASCHGHVTALLRLRRPKGFARRHATVEGLLDAAEDEGLDEEILSPLLARGVGILRSGLGQTLGQTHETSG